jgi:hypothetical protein
MKKLVFLLALSLILSVPVFAVTVTVSTTGGAGEFNSIQYAIVSCLTNPDSPDVINILDNGPYFEALDIGTSGFDLTIQGVSGSRPVIVASMTSATTGPFGNRNTAIDILVDMSTTVIKDIVLIPDTTAAPYKGIAINQYTALSQYTVALINVVIAGNDGSAHPVTMDGRTVVSAATTFTGQAIDVGSASNPGHISLEKVIVSRATNYTGDGAVRVLLDGVVADRASVYFGPGCVFSYNPLDGIYFGTSNYCDATFSGTSTDPIIITNNARWGIWDLNNVGNAAVNKLDWVIIANNGSMGYRVSGTSNPLNVTMTNCTFANNAISASTAQIDLSAAAVAMNINATNVIFAGNGNLNTSRANTIILGSGSLTINNSAIVLKGAYSLNTMAIDTATGVIGTVTPTSITNRNPIFWSLDPANAKFAKVGNAFYATAGPASGPLTGGGQFELNTGIVSVAPSIALVSLSGTQTFYSSGGTPPYIWASSSTAIGTIDSASGLFTALSLGTTIISATDFDGNVGTATVSVIATNAPMFAEPQAVVIQRMVPFGELFE